MHLQGILLYSKHFHKFHFHRRLRRGFMNIHMEVYILALLFVSCVAVARLLQGSEPSFLNHKT